jgi:hypothetical protein
VVSKLLRAQDRRDFDVQVLAPDYSGVIGSIPDYLSCSVTWQKLGVGSGSLTTTERGKAALQLLQARDYVVPVTVKVPGLPRWSGRVHPLTAPRHSGQAGRITATLTDETTWVRKILAVPVPGSDFDHQYVEHDSRTGPLVTVVKGYLQDNIARLNVEYAARGLGRLPLAVVPPPEVDTSPTVALQARNVPIQTVVTDALDVAGRDLTATLWLPGDPQLLGLTLSSPTVVLDVTEGRSRPYVNFTDLVGGVVDRTLGLGHPGALAVLVLGPGQGVERRMVKVWADDGRVERLGVWGWPEDTLEATDVDVDVALDSNLIARGLTQLNTELAGTTSIGLSLADRRPWTIAPDGDVWVNDLARASISGVTVEDRIDRVTATSNRDGFSLTPQFGASRDTQSPDAQLARAVAAIRQQITRDQTGR